MPFSIIAILANVSVKSDKIVLSIFANTSIVLDKYSIDEATDD
jgi:hypothetical protein